MHQKEIEYFSKGLKLANDGLIIDSISSFQSVINDFPESELADDASYNISLLYFKINQFEKSIENLFMLIDFYPDGKISTMDTSNEVGSIVEKAKYLLVQCYLALDNVKKAEEIFDKMLNDGETYLVNNGEKRFYYDLTKDSIRLFKEIK